MNKLKFLSKFSKEINKEGIKTISRNSIISNFHIDKSFYVHNGHKFILVNVNWRMEGYYFGEFAKTRGVFGFKKVKKKGQKKADKKKRNNKKK